MKRIVSLLLAMALCLCFVGCDVLDYKEAMDLYEAGEYAQALEIYRALGDYADSARMAEICWQKADYEAAENHFAAGEYAQALELYQGLDMYMDSPVQAIVCQYRLGLESLDAGSYAQAIEWLVPLGSYEDCLEQVHLARWLWLLTYLEEQEGQVQMPGKTEGSVVSLRLGEEASVQLCYESEGQLLGMPYESNLIINIFRKEPLAAYTAMYNSESTSKIREEATGTVELAVFDGTYEVLPGEFSQTHVDPDGVETVSDDPADAIMLEVVLAEAVAAMAECLPQLIEASGVEISLADMCFDSLT